MTICTCAIHCPQSPHHEYACCRSDNCDCWCHQIANSHQKAIVARASIEQRNEAERAYIAHKRHCAGVGIEPASFGVYIAEWIECAGIEAQAIEAPGPGDHHQLAQAQTIEDYQSRSYDRMFEGKRGWD